MSLPDVDVEKERKKIAYSQDREKLKREIAAIKKELEGDNLKETLDNQKEYILEMERKKKEKTAELARLQESQNLFLRLSAQHTQIKKQIEGIVIEEVDRSRLEQLEKDLQEVTQELQELRKGIAAQLQLLQMIEMFNKYESALSKEKKITERISSLQKVRSTLITAEYIILDTILSNLNVIIADVLGILFKEPITVTLRSLRQLKTNDRIKPEINIEIYYKGAEFTSLNELSGGEKSRVSLALVIAFARIGKNPFLLLDESLSSLDVTTKEMAITAIKRYLSNKLVIAVNHDTTEGVYDSVLRLS